MKESEIQGINESLQNDFAKLSIRDIVILSLESQHSYKFIEKITGVKENTIKTIVRRHRSKVSKQYLAIAGVFLNKVSKVLDPKLQEDFEMHNGVF